MSLSEQEQTALDRLRNPTPHDKVQNYLCHAIHKRRCNGEGHGPYKHEDEAGYYADVALKLALEMPDEQSGITW